MFTKPTDNNLTEHAIHRLTRTQLSPLEEALFQSWAKAHNLADTDGKSDKFDYRAVYKQSGGQVMPPDNLKKMADIETLMKAQEEHEKESPIQKLMGEQNG